MYFSVDTPDPYVVVHVRGAPDGRKATTTRDNDVNPEWNEELRYFLPCETETKIMAEVRVITALLCRQEHAAIRKFGKIKKAN